MTDEDGDVELEDTIPSGTVGLTAAQRAERDSQIVAAKMRGLSWGQISTTYEVSERRCKEIHAAYRKANPTLRHHDPVDIVDEMLEGYQGVIEELALISATTTNDSARVGAVNAKMSAYTKITELLQAIGVMPNDLGSLKIEIDARFVAEQVMKVFTAYDLPPEVEDAMLKALRGEAFELPPGAQN
jgi:hypothetical protein